MSNRFRELFPNPTQVEPWLAAWQTRLDEEGCPDNKIISLMNGTNPAFIPRNHRVEKAIADAENKGDFSETHRLIDMLKNPYVEQPDYSEYMLPPKPEEKVLQTFCGT